MNSQDIAELLSTIAAAWPTFRPTPMTAAVWASALEEMPVEDAVLGLAALVKTASFPPCPADLIAACYGRVIKIPQRPRDCWGREMLDKPIESWTSERSRGVCRPNPAFEIGPGADEPLRIGDSITGPGIEA